MAEAEGQETTSWVRLMATFIDGVDRRSGGVAPIRVWSLVGIA
jgi:hypothetical protein